MNYYFNREIATKHGVEEAILLENIMYWTEKNKANDKHYYDGRNWTYNSLKAFEELFPFWSKRQIERILKSLKDQRLIYVGNYNKMAYDRTNWYTLTEYANALYSLENTISPNSEIDLTKSVNGITQSVTPIPINKPDTKTQLVNTYTSNAELQKALFDFIDMRKYQKSKMSDNSFNLILNKLSKLASSDNEKIEILNESIMNGWKGVFALKGDKNGGIKQPNKQPSSAQKYDFSKYGG